MNIGLKMKFEKEKEKKRKPAPAPFQPRWPKRPIKPPAPAHFSPLLLFFSPRGADDRGSPVSLPFPPFLSSSSRRPTEPAPPRDSRRARPPPHLPFLSPQSIKAIKHPVIN
jgi:hypothetical protein